jgi:hypothetical protein
MGVEDHERCFFLRHVPQYSEQNAVFKNIGVVAGMKGVAITKHNCVMETKWLEDFVSLAETRSFSRSAQLRHVTQPAFSRRIQSLEAWAGTILVDRSSYPTRLTPAGEILYDQSIELLQVLHTTRTLLRRDSCSAKEKTH